MHCGFAEPERLVYPQEIELVGQHRVAGDAVDQSAHEREIVRIVDRPAQSRQIHRAADMAWPEPIRPIADERGHMLAIGTQPRLTRRGLERRHRHRLDVETVRKTGRIDVRDIIEAAGERVERAVDQIGVDQRAIAGEADHMLGIAGAGRADEAIEHVVEAAAEEGDPAASIAAASASSDGSTLVATHRPSRRRARRTRSHMNRIDARPAIGSSVLPGSRVELVRAWMIATERGLALMPPGSRASG